MRGHLTLPPTGTLKRRSPTSFSAYNQPQTEITKEVVRGQGVAVQHVHLLLVPQGEALLQEQRVPFKEVNIERDPDAAREIVRKTGQTGRTCDQDREQLDRGLR
jgi:hypothetical protein